MTVASARRAAYTTARVLGGVQAARSGHLGSFLALSAIFRILTRGLR